MKENKIINLDWESISKIVVNMGEKIKKEYEPEIIISIVRGGMIPCVILSHYLNVRNIKNITSIETESDEINAKKHEPIINYDLNLQEIKNKKVLIVDDILGSGATIRKITNEIKKWNPEEIKTAICVVNEDNWEKSNTTKCENEVNYIGKKVRGWVVFPWENKEEI